MRTVQIQKNRNGNIDAKLDKIKELMEEVLIELKGNDEAYTQESKVKVGTLKRLTKMAKDIAQGRRKTVKFRNIQDLDRIVSGYKV